ncbi:MAG: putative arabinose efflux permease, family [Marmoricola sp.]|nr:putative arabinose efflux permease, family [Marmoricola sp.]
MLSPYRRVLSTPGALAFSLAGLVARMPISMMTLGIVLLVSRTSGSYAVAGQVSAAYVVGNASCAVVHGRLADRLGQGRVLLGGAVVYALGTVALLVAVTRDAPLAWSLLAAAVAGVGQPQVGAMVRARWAHLLHEPSLRHTAFSLEGVLDEVVFVTGPTLVTFVATAAAPQTGLLLAVALGTVGTVALAVQHGTAPPAAAVARARGRGRLPVALLAVLGLAFLALGAVFGALEVATVAVAREEGHPAFAGVMLATFSAGSLVAGVVSGAATVRRHPLVRARVGLVLLALGTLPLPLLPGLAGRAVVLTLVGLTLAPTLVALFSLVEQSVPPGRLTEAIGLVGTGVAGGIAPGAWAAGVVADGSGGGGAAYAVCVVAAVLAAVTALLVRRPPDPDGRAGAPEPGAGV